MTYEALRACVYTSLIPQNHSQPVQSVHVELPFSSGQALGIGLLPKFTSPYTPMTRRARTRTVSYARLTLFVVAIRPRSDAQTTSDLNRFKNIM
jgi:hypothetical protein